MNKTLIKFLNENNFTFKQITMTDGKKGIMIDTNYDGPYPKKETYALHDCINKKCKRLKGIRTEPRGFYTALLVVES